MLEKIKAVIDIMKENDVRSIDFYCCSPDVRIECTKILKTFDTIPI